MSAPINWSVITVITQVVGFIGAIIVILITTHKITKNFTELRKDVEHLRDSDVKRLNETIEKQRDKLEEFTILYKTDIAIRQERENIDKKLKEEQERKLKEKEKEQKQVITDKKEGEENQNE